MGKIKLSSDAKKVFEILIRTTFAYGYLPQFLYNTNSEESKIDIRRDFPQRLRKAPSINITSSSGDTSIDELGPTAPRLENIDDDPDSQPADERITEYRGHSTFEIIFDIFAGSRDDRDVISDFLVICLRFLFRKKAAENGFEYTKIIIGSDGDDIHDDVTYYTKTVTIKCLSEFHWTIPIELADIINKLDFEIETI